MHTNHRFCSISNLLRTQQTRTKRRKNLFWRNLNLSEATSKNAPILLHYVILGFGEGNGTPLDGGAWKTAVHGVAEHETQLSDFTFTFYFHALEKEMATCSSVLAWRIPGRDRGAWWAAVCGVTQSRTRLKWLSSSSSSSSSSILGFGLTD